MSKMNQSFETWSFDGPCTEMEWTELVSASLSVTADTNGWDDADLVIVGVFAPKQEDGDDDGDEKEEETSTVALSGGAKSLDEKLSGALSQIMLENAKEFKHGAEVGSSTATLRVVSNGKSCRFVAMGLGTEPSEDDDDNARIGVGFAIGKGIASKCDSEKKAVSVKMLLPAGFGCESSTLTDISSSFYATLYSDNRYRTGKNIKRPAEDLKSVLLVSEGTIVDRCSDAIDDGKKLAAGIHMAKDIVNAPHNVLNSLSLADTARRIAEESDGTLTCTILGKKECEARGMGAYLGVARASETDPQFIHITYTPPDKVFTKRVGVVGKGLLFDTGGYNIKTSMMELMKFDCGGSAAVLGASFRTETMFVSRLGIFRVSLKSIFRKDPTTRRVLRNSVTEILTRCFFSRTFKGLRERWPP